MGLKKVDIKGIRKQTARSSYGGKKNFILEEFEELKLKRDQTYVLRILPPNEGDLDFATDFSGIAMHTHVHWNVGQQAREFVPCPERVAPRYRVTCPSCAAFSAGSKAKSDKLSISWYANVVLMKAVEGVEQYTSNKKLKVYTVRLATKDVYTVIADYYGDEERGVADICDLKDGCAVIIKVSSTTGDGNTYTQYTTRIAETKTKDITEFVNEDDIKDLRLVNLYIPSTKALQAIYDGMPVDAAMDEYGKINTVTGEHIGVSEDVVVEDDDFDTPDSESIDLLDDDINILDDDDDIEQPV